jgi:hypothetical protein
LITLLIVYSYYFKFNYWLELGLIEAGDNFNRINLDSLVFAYDLTLNSAIVPVAFKESIVVV